MAEQSSNLNRQIAERVKQLRANHALSLEALAAKSSVSRSMISLIERGESSPTAVVLEKLAAAFGVPLASLFDAVVSEASTPRSPLARYEDQLEWRDPASGYLRRNVSPPGVPQPMQIVEVHFPAGGRVAFEAAAREIRIYQQIWILEGKLDISFGEERHRLHQGDCLAMQLEGSTIFHNPTRKLTRYVVVVASTVEVRPRT